MNFNLGGAIRSNDGTFEQLTLPESRQRQVSVVPIFPTKGAPDGLVYDLGYPPHAVIPVNALHTPQPLSFQSLAGGIEFTSLHKRLLPVQT